MYVCLYKVYIVQCTYNAISFIGRHSHSIQIFPLWRWRKNTFGVNVLYIIEVYNKYKKQSKLMKNTLSVFVVFFSCFLYIYLIFYVHTFYTQIFYIYVYTQTHVYTYRYRSYILCLYAVLYFFSLRLLLCFASFPWSSRRMTYLSLKKYRF